MAVATVVAPADVAAELIADVVTEVGPTDVNRGCPLCPRGLCHRRDGKEQKAQ